MCENCEIMRSVRNQIAVAAQVPPYILYENCPYCGEKLDKEAEHGTDEH